MTDEAFGPRRLGPAIRNGLMHRCPACGEGALFTSYLKVASHCDRCGEALFHQRADDGPAYLTLLLACHVVGLLLHPMVRHTELAPGAIAAILTGLIVPLCLLLLPRTKGLMIAVQWAKRMHGFGRPPEVASEGGETTSAATATV